MVVESHRGRRFWGRLDRGVDLVEGLAEVCRARGVRCAELRASGFVEDAELRELDQRARAFRPSRRFASPFTVVHCLGRAVEHEGRILVEATCALSRERDNGIELLGGQLVHARVYAVEFVIETFDDILLRRSMDPSTGLLLLSEARELREPTLAGAPPPPPPEIPFEAPARGRYSEPGAPGEAGIRLGSVEAATDPGPAPAGIAAERDPGRTPAPFQDAAPSWEEVAATSAAQPPVEEPEPETPLREGDVIEHPRFGRCEVERIEGDSEYAQVRLRNRRLVRLSLDVIQLIREGSDDAGHRCYRAMVLR